jgi:general secretion pathway protein D
LIEEIDMQIKRCLLAALLLGISLTATAQPPAGQRPPGQPIAVPSPTGSAEQPAVRSLSPLPENAPIVDIFALIDRLAEEMDKEFIIDPRMRGISAMSTAGDDADYDTLLALLRSNGYAAIEVGEQIRIVPEATARTEPSQILNEDDSRVSDHAVVTRVIDVAGIEIAGEAPAAGGAAPMLVPVLRPLMSTQIGNVTTIPGTTKIVIVDRYDNVRRITAIIDALRE